MIYGEEIIAYPLVFYVELLLIHCWEFIFTVVSRKLISL